MWSYKHLNFSAYILKDGSTQFVISTVRTWKILIKHFNRIFLQSECTLWWHVDSAITNTFIVLWILHILQIYDPFAFDSLPFYFTIQFISFYANNNRLVLFTLSSAIYPGSNLGSNPELNKTTPFWLLFFWSFLLPWNVIVSAK